MSIGYSFIIMGSLTGGYKKEKRGSVTKVRTFFRGEKENESSTNTRVR